MNAGEQMLDSFRLANERQRKIEEQDKRIAELEAALAQERVAHEATRFALAQKDVALDYVRESRDSWMDKAQAAQAAHEATKAELDEVQVALCSIGSDSMAKTARLRTAESEINALKVAVYETMTALDVPDCGDIYKDLAWLRDNVKGKAVRA